MRLIFTTRPPLKVYKVVHRYITTLESIANFSFSVPVLVRSLEWVSYRLSSLLAADRYGAGVWELLSQLVSLLVGAAEDALVGPALDKVPRVVAVVTELQNV